MTAYWAIVMWCIIRPKYVLSCTDIQTMREQQGYAVNPFIIA